MCRQADHFPQKPRCLLNGILLNGNHGITIKTESERRDWPGFELTKKRLKLVRWNLEELVPLFPNVTETIGQPRPHPLVEKTNTLGTRLEAMQLFGAC